MAFTVMNNPSAMMTLGELNKNINNANKSQNKLATGMKINSAGDDTSGYSISERMKARLRALDKANENTKTGFNMIDTASQAVQEQLNIMKGIKEKVINAHNDSNTDLDRLTIQKEIDHGFEQIQDIAYETTYNGKRLLSGGDYVKESVFAWEVGEEALELEGSGNLNLIPNNFDSLDGIEGPFDVFSLWNTKRSYDGGKTGLTNTVPWDIKTENVENYVHAEFELTFDYTDVEDMDDKGLYVQGYDDEGNGADAVFVFSRQGSDNYNNTGHTPVIKVDISTSDSVEVAVNKLANAINTSTTGNCITATADGNKITLTSKCDTAKGDLMSASGASLRVEGKTGFDREAAVATGASFGTFSGGVNSSGVIGDPDAPYVPGKPASATVTGLDSADANSGFGIRLPDGSTMYIRMDDSSSYSNRQASDKTYTIGKNSSFSDVRFGGLTFSYEGGTLEITTPASASYNSASFVDGIPASSKTIVSGFTPVTNVSVTQGVKTKTEFEPAKFILDLSAYKGNTSMEDAEKFIHSLTGVTDNFFNWTGGRTYEFVDRRSKSDVASLGKLPEYYNSAMIDLNTMRRAVSSGKDIATAFSELVYSVVTTSDNSYTGIYKDDAGDTVGVYFADKDELNPYTILTDNDVTIGHYAVDFSSVSTYNLSALDEKGFRFYCATDDLQWYNFLLDDGKEDLPDRPKSGTEKLDINTAVIDISKITDTASLVQAIYKDGDKMMAELDHFYRLALDGSDEKKLIIYDNRLFDISTYRAYKDAYNERGAKIADAVYDTVEKSRRDIMQNRIVIQDTDKAGFNTRIYINQTTLDHLFGYKVGSDDIFNYRISEAKTREKFLGNDETGEKGMLDTAIDYLLDAQTLLGAQAARLEATSANLTATSENEQASESTIRDADMAKEQMEYAKFNILTQASQSMLAQANQNSSSVLSLLQ